MIPNLFIPGFTKSLNSISFLWLSGLAAGLLGFLTQIILARYLTVGDYGAFSAAYRLICILAPVAGFGVGAYWLRCFGKEGVEGRRWIRPSLKLVAITSCGTMGIIWGFGFVAGFDEDVRTLIYRLVPVVLFWASTELVRGRFQLEGRYRALALWDTLFSLVCLSVACLLVLSRKGLYFLSAGYATGGLVLTVLGGIILYGMSAGFFDLAGHPAADRADKGKTLNVPTVIAVLKGALPFALAGIFYMIYFQIGVVMVGWYDGSSSAGMYNVAITIMSAVYLLPGAVYQKFLMPKIHRWAEHDRGKFIEVYSFGNGAMFLCGLFFMLCVLISAFTVVPWFFGSRYADAGRILLILSISVPIRFLSTNVGSTLVTGEHMRRKNLYQGMGALLNILLNLLFIPTLGFYGAALSAVLTELMLLTTYSVGVRNHVLGPKVWKSWSFRLTRPDNHERDR